MKTHFCLTRLLRVLRWLYIYEYKKALNLFLFAVPVFTWFQTYSFYNWEHGNHFRSADDTLDLVANASLFFLAVLMCLGATFAFSTLHRRHAGRQLLLLPASNLEKCLALWLIYVPLLLVVLIAAFCVSDLLRMLLLPLLMEQSHWPSAIPAFCYFLWMWVSDPILPSLALVFAIHAFCLLSSVVAGYVGWLLSGLTVFGCAYYLIGYYDGTNWQVLLLFLLGLVLLLLTYRLFCRYPLLKNLFNLRSYGL